MDIALLYITQKCTHRIGPAPFFSLVFLVFCTYIRCFLFSFALGDILFLLTRFFLLDSFLFSLSASLCLQHSLVVPFIVPFVPRIAGFKLENRIFEPRTLNF